MSAGGAYGPEPPGRQEAARAARPSVPESPRPISSSSSRSQQLFQETNEPPIVIWVMGTAQNGPSPRQWIAPHEGRESVFGTAISGAARLSSGTLAATQEFLRRARCIFRLTRHGHAPRPLDALLSRPMWFDCGRRSVIVEPRVGIGRFGGYRGLRKARPRLAPREPRISQHPECDVVAPPLHSRAKFISDEQLRSKKSGGELFETCCVRHNMRTT